MSHSSVPQGGQTSTSRTPLLIPTATKCHDEGIDILKRGLQSSFSL